MILHIFADFLLEYLIFNIEELGEESLAVQRLDHDQITDTFLGLLQKR